MSNYPTPDTANDDYFYIDDEPTNDDPGDYPEESER